MLVEANQPSSAEFFMHNLLLNLISCSKLTNHLLSIWFQVFLVWWLMWCTHRSFRSRSASVRLTGGPTTGTTAGPSGMTELRDHTHSAFVQECRMKRLGSTVLHLERYINKVKSTHLLGNQTRNSILRLAAPNRWLCLCSHLSPASLSLMKKAQSSHVMVGLGFDVQSPNTGVIGIA